MSESTPLQPSRSRPLRSMEQVIQQQLDIRDRELAESELRRSEAVAMCEQLRAENERLRRDVIRRDNALAELGYCVFLDDPASDRIIISRAGGDSDIVWADNPNKPMPITPDPSTPVSQLDSDIAFVRSVYPDAICSTGIDSVTDSAWHQIFGGNPPDVPCSERMLSPELAWANAREFAEKSTLLAAIKLESATTRESIKSILSPFSPEYLASCGIC